MTIPNDFISLKTYSWNQMAEASCARDQPYHWEFSELTSLQVDDNVY